MAAFSRFFNSTVGRAAFGVMFLLLALLRFAADGLSVLAVAFVVLALVYFFQAWKRRGG